MPQSSYRARPAAGGKVLGTESRRRARQTLGTIRGGAMKDVISLRRVMPGSPKALTPQI